MNGKEEKVNYSSNNVWIMLVKRIPSSLNHCRTSFYNLYLPTQHSILHSSKTTTLDSLIHKQLARTNTSSISHRSKLQTESDYARMGIEICHVKRLLSCMMMRPSWQEFRYVDCSKCLMSLPYLSDWTYEHYAFVFSMVIMRVSARDPRSWPEKKSWLPLAIVYHSSAAVSSTTTLTCFSSSS